MAGERRIFLSSGPFVVPAGVTNVNVLTVGGGGGGGRAGSAGAGGGAGRVRYDTALAVTPGATINVTVGAGGAGRTATTGAGSAGAASAFGALTSAAGGGAGGGGGAAPGGAGASGGGGSGASTGSMAGGIGSAGFDGGNGANDTANVSTVTRAGCGGGGGAGSIGGSASFTGGASGGTVSGGAGGIGVDYSALVGVDVGQSGWFGAGGGGGTQHSSGVTATGGAGGKGGGGEGRPGGATTAAPAGAANTGSGGGGGAGSSPSGIATDGGIGGSGVVIITWGGWEPELPPPPPVVVPGTSTASLTAPVDRAGKPTSRRVFRHGGKWAAILPTSSGHRLYPDLKDPVPGLVVDSRQPSRVTVVTAPNWLGVLRQHVTASRFSSYRTDLTPLVVDAPVPLTDEDNDSSPVTLHRSPNGYLWAGVIAGGSILVSRSTDNGATWSSAAALGAYETGAVGITSSGATVVLLANGNDSLGRAAMSISQSSASIALPAWTAETLPALPANVYSDDHLDVASTADGRVLAIAKTTNNARDLLLLYAMVRSVDGIWTMHEIESGPDNDGFGVASPGYTRPSIVVDGATVSIYYGSIWPPAYVSTRSASLDALSVWSSRTAALAAGNFSDGAILPVSEDIANGGGEYPLLAHDRDAKNIVLAWRKSAPSLARVTWWDGAAQTAVPNGLVTYWDGATQRPLRSYWDGQKEVPLFVPTVV